MDAMILAAGLGTRLGDITRDRPKALVEVAGATALEHVARRLIDAGADRLIINVHHHADAVVELVEARGGFGVPVAFSREEEAPLETGGGLLHAAPLFRRDAPFFLHNVDVLSTADLRAMYAAHRDSGALATLAVSDRESSRHLVFDSNGLCGRGGRASEGDEDTCSPPVERYPFAGIHVLSPEVPDLITERGAFSILDVYLRLARAGHRILPWHLGAARWLEIGNPARLAEARRVLGGSDPG